jgi:hypothetical protein
VSQLAVVPPSIVISGQPEGRRLADGAGAVEFVAKPFDVDRLLAVVALVIHALPTGTERLAP